MVIDVPGFARVSFAAVAAAADAASQHIFRLAYFSFCFHYRRHYFRFQSLALCAGGAMPKERNKRIGTTKHFLGFRVSSMCLLSSETFDSDANLCHRIDTKYRKKKN